MLAAGNDRVLAVFQNRRWDGDFLALRDLLARGALGEVSHFESHFDRYRPLVRDRWRERAGAGAGLWYDLGPHLVDQALQLFGLPDRVWGSLAAQRAGSQVDDWAHAVLEYNRRRVDPARVGAGGRAVVRGSSCMGRTAAGSNTGVDAQEQQLVAALTPGGTVAPGEPEQAVMVDGASGTRTSMPVPPGDYPEFYLRVRDAIVALAATLFHLATSGRGRGRRRNGDQIVGRRTRVGGAVDRIGTSRIRQMRRVIVKLRVASALAVSRSS